MSDVAHCREKYVNMQILTTGYKMFLLCVFVRRILSTVVLNTGPFVSPSGRWSTHTEIALWCQTAALFHREAQMLFFMLAVIALVLTVSRLRQQYEMIVWTLGETPFKLPSIIFSSRAKVC